VTGLDVRRTLYACIMHRWHLRNDSSSIVAADVQRLNAGRGPASHWHPLAFVTLKESQTGLSIHMYMVKPSLLQIKATSISLCLFPR
jgi:hypothetical protein